MFLLIHLLIKSDELLKLKILPKVTGIMIDGHWLVFYYFH